MGFDVEVVADSVSAGGVRLTTLAVTLPRIVLAEFNTHRVFARNSASSRAIPVEKMIQKVLDDPFVPVYWGKNQPGMQAREELSGASIDKATVEWLVARDAAVTQARRLLDIGAHKQVVNRLLEPWTWTSVVVTATDWQNFFNLRCHPDAQPEIRRAAEMMREARDASDPRYVHLGEWHLPYVDFDDEVLLPLSLTDPERPLALAEVSAARCARVSYLRHGEARAFQEDRAFAQRLRQSGHWSPLEHPATPLADPRERCGPFQGWRQLRKVHPDESGEPEKSTCERCGRLSALLRTGGPHRLDLCPLCFTE